jgi:hypothetical protein
MDDDLMSLRGNSPPAAGSSGDDLLGDMGAPTPASANPPSQGADAGLSIEGFDIPASAPPAPIKAGKPARSAVPKRRPAPGASRGNFLGLTPQQRMLLSIFLFMDVGVLGCLILIAVGALKV